MAWREFILYLVLALVLGALIGAERQWHGRLAGLRTNALVSSGAAMFVSITHLMPGTNSLQVAGQVVSGIGFLGAGVIMREGLTIRGLNTAATLWCSAAVGSLCGLGFLKEAAVGAVGVLAANVLLRPLARKIDRQPSHGGDVESEYVLRLTCRGEDEAKIRALLMHLLHDLPLALRSLHSEDVNATGKVEVRAILVSPERENAMLETVVQRLSLEPGISAVSWEVATREGE